MLLEKVRRARPAALRQAMTSALHDASARSNGQEALASGGVGKGSPALPFPLLDLLELVARVHGGEHSSRVSEDGMSLAPASRDGPFPRKNAPRTTNPPSSFRKVSRDGLR